MIRFADISIPIDLARKLAIATDRRTAMDDGYVVKSALAEAFGPGAVRPWRLVEVSDGLYRVVGVVADGADLKPTPTSRKLGMIPEVIPFEVETGDVLSVDVLATPVKRLTFRHPETRERTGGAFVDITTARDPEGQLVAATGADRDAAYMRWLVEYIGTSENGVRPIDMPEINSTRPHRQLRKRRGEVGTIVTPCVRARMQIIVDDREKFVALLHRGIKKLKDVGLGSILPVSILEDLA